jgi:hypothetical protein
MGDGGGDEDDAVTHIEVDALMLAGQQSLSGGEIGAAERAFSAALRRVPPEPPGRQHDPRAGLVALTSGQRLRYQLHGSRCEARLRLGLHFGALDDSVARLALASTKEAVAQGKAVDVALHGAPPPSPAKSRGGAASYAAALRMKGTDRPGRRSHVGGSNIGWWSDAQGGGVGGGGEAGEPSPSKTGRGAEFRSVPGPGQRRSAAATAVQEAKAAEANMSLRRSAVTGKLDVEVMRGLLHNGADVGQPDSSGRTILRLALAHGQHRVVRMLLDYCYRELWLQQRVAWALAAAPESRVGRSCAAYGVSRPVVLAVVEALGRRCREDTEGLDTRVLRHLLERRQLALARDFGAATGAALIGGTEAARAKETTLRAADDLLAAIESPQR